MSNLHVPLMESTFLCGYTPLQSELTLLTLLLLSSFQFESKSAATPSPFIKKSKSRTKSAKVHVQSISETCTEQQETGS